MSERPRYGELAELRRELRELRMYLDDHPDLKDRVNAWISSSLAVTDADTAREYVEKQLEQYLIEYPMYHSPGVDRGEDAFPDECADCQHYGSACPVLQDDVEKRWRERKLAEAETDEEARQVYQQQAIDTGCKRIPEHLERWDTEIADLVRDGEKLAQRANAAIADELEPGGEDDDLRAILEPADDLDQSAHAAPGGGS